MVPAAMRPRRSGIPLVLLALAAGALAVALGGGGDDGGDASAARGAAEALVLRVVDGDTILVSLGGRRERVRYIGIDTPESVKPGSPVECFAKRAAARNRALVDGRRVTLRFDAEERDRYGRLLAYVHRDTPPRFVNAALVSEGYAQTLTIPPNVARAELFRRLQREAREAGRGLWSACR
jgi:micrococcal nuclease